MQRQGKNFVETMCEGLRDMESERIRRREQKYIETNQDAILKEKNAKRTLIELEECTTSSRKITASKGILHRHSECSFINPWDFDDNAPDE